MHTQTAKIVDHEKPEAFERKGESGVWSTEEIGPEGEIHQAIFIGPEAEKRAKEYAVFKYGK